jgi:hypothetical protein
MFVFEFLTLQSSKGSHHNQAVLSVTEALIVRLLAPYRNLFSNHEYFVTYITQQAAILGEPLPEEVIDFSEPLEIMQNPKSTLHQSQSRRHLPRDNHRKMSISG